MPLLILKGHRPATFRRAGYTFPPREAVEVDAKHLVDMEDDIGPVLAFCRLDDKGRPRIVETLEEATAPVKTAKEELPNEPDGPDAGDEDKPLEELTVPQLKTLAEEEDVDISGAKNKADIIAALKAAGVE